MQLQQVRPAASSIWLLHYGRTAVNKCPPITTMLVKYCCQTSPAFLRPATSSSERIRVTPAALFAALSITITNLATSTSSSRALAVTWLLLLLLLLPTALSTAVDSGRRSLDTIMLQQCPSIGSMLWELHVG
jgi:hypothetical protein